MEVSAVPVCGLCLEAGPKQPAYREFADDTNSGSSPAFCYLLWALSGFSALIGHYLMRNLPAIFFDSQSGDNKRGPRPEAWGARLRWEIVVYPPWMIAQQTPDTDCVGRSPAISCASSPRHLPPKVALLRWNFALFSKTPETGVLCQFTLPAASDTDIPSDHRSIA